MIVSARRSLSRRALLGLPAPATRACARIADECLALNDVMCESCADVCETKAIRFSRGGFMKQPSIDPERCTACEECLSVCPVGALSIERPKVAEV
jgi:ferredoxin-type protein NapF